MLNKKKKLIKNKVKFLKIKKRLCPVCNSKKIIKLFNEDNWKKMDAFGRHYIINKRYCICSNCNLVYTNPTVNSKVFDNLYSSAIVGSVFDNESKKHRLKIEYFKKICKSYIKKNFSFLDIGSGNATLLKFLSKNYDIKKRNLYGIEPSKPIYKKFKKNNFFKLYNSFLDNFNPKKKFDFLILDNVFEHFDFPNKSLDKLHKLLKNKGFIYISVPNVKAIRFTQGDPFNHTCNYNFSTLRVLLNNKNFKVIKKSFDNKLINLLVVKNNNTKEKFRSNPSFIKFMHEQIKKITKDKKKLTNRLKKLRDKIIKKNYKIVTFGAGNYSLWILDKLKIKKNILYGIDNNILYHNKIRNNIQIFNPNRLKVSDFEKVLVLSFAFKKEIMKQLYKLKIPKKKIISL
tara:strand:+ start:252 stop:1451 length:1200 start_codon:yes stop_codon:yes gene_type:complete